MNRKKTQRLYPRRGPLLKVAVPNAPRSVDFVHEQFAEGRQFLIFNVIDDVTKECLAAEVDNSISGRRVARELTALIARHGRPGLIVSDYRTEFASNAMLAWSEETGVSWHFIARASGCRTVSARPSIRRCGMRLNATLFCSLDHARRVIAAWVAEYNAAKPIQRSATRPRGLTDRNGRSASRTGSVPPIAHCYLRASGYLSPAGSGFRWMSVVGQSRAELCKPNSVSTNL